MKRSKLYAVLATIILSATFASALPDEKFSYIENDHIKLGVITNYGATIGYFSKVAPVRNFVNYMDAGREIQQSYYGWIDGSYWAGNNWRWNPVQGGSYQNRKPELLNFVNENNTIYARSHPRNWAGQELIENCFMEEWISLESNVAHITFRMCYSGPSNGVMHGQELPATFLDAYFDRLTYCNEAPWSYNTLTNFKPPGIPDGTPPDVNHDYKTEYWSAYVKNGWGMGVYTPEKEYFGFYWVGGAQGNEGGACSHFSTLGIFQIITNFTYEYDVYLAIGMTNEIRDAFYDVYDGIINPGFEAGNLTNWTKTGTAWNDSPETIAYWPAQQVGYNCEGKFFALSRRSPYTIGDAETATGTLRSPNFFLKKDEQLSFLICGWSHYFTPNYNYAILCRASDDVELDKVWAPDVNTFQSRLLSHGGNDDIEVYIKIVDDCMKTAYAWFGVDDFFKVGYDSSFGQNNGFEIGDFSNWTVSGSAFGSEPVTTNFAPWHFENCGLDGRYYANSMKGGETQTGTLTSPSFVLPVNSTIKFLIGGHSSHWSPEIFNYAVLKLASDNSEIDRIYAPGSNILTEKSFDAVAAYGQEVYVEVVDNCTSSGWAWLSVDNFIVAKIFNFENIEVDNKNFSSPNISVGTGSQTVDRWRCKGDVGITNINPQISPFAGQTIFINNGELFQTFENVKLLPATFYQLTFDSYSIGSKQTIKAGLGYGISSGENSVFVAPVATENVIDVNKGTGAWLGESFASGALFTNVLNPSADDPAISHVFIFQTPENLDYTRISCDLGVRFWDASGEQIQLDNVSVTNFPTIPEGGLLFWILGSGFLFILRKIVKLI